MISLQNDQELFTPCEYLVCQGGDYDEYDLVEVYRKDDVDKKPWVAYHAGYIAQGGDFYIVKDGE